MHLDFIHFPVEEMLHIHILDVMENPENRKGQACFLFFLLAEAPKRC